jgi:predicted RNase H-like HicB family nuclease
VSARIFTVYWSDQKQAFVGTCNHFPYMQSTGATEEEARRKIEEEVTEWEDDLQAEYAVSKVRELERCGTEPDFNFVVDAAYEYLKWYRPWLERECVEMAAAIIFGHSMTREIE